VLKEGVNEEAVPKAVLDSGLQQLRVWIKMGFGGSD
jgi:hypothetical protein